MEWRNKGSIAYLFDCHELHHTQLDGHHLWIARRKRYPDTWQVAWRPLGSGQGNGFQPIDAKNKAEAQNVALMLFKMR